MELLAKKLAPKTVRDVIGQKHLLGDGKKVIYDVYGKKLAYYDGRYTYNIYGVRVGEGNFLVLFIKVPAFPTTTF